MIVYDPEQWKHCENITARQFLKYMENHVPPDAVFHVCGDSQFYIYVSVDGGMVCVDDCALSGLVEYEGNESGGFGLEG